MRRPVNWLVASSSAILLLTAMKLPGGAGSGGGDSRDPSPMVASEAHQITFAYLPRDHFKRAVIPALLTTRESGMSSIESPPLLQFELLGNPDL
jgi:hypothetical protein